MFHGALMNTFSLHRAASESLAKTRSNRSLNSISPPINNIRKTRPNRRLSACYFPDGTMFFDTLSETPCHGKFDSASLAIKALSHKSASFFRITFSAPLLRFPGLPPARQSNHLTQNRLCFFEFTARPNSRCPSPAYPSVKLEKAVLAPAWPRRLPYRE